MHNEVNIPSKKWKCSILHKRCPFFSAEQTVRRWRSDGGRPQSDLGWLRSLTNHQHPWLARNVLSGQRNIDFKIECVHYFYSLLCTPLGQCVSWAIHNWLDWIFQFMVDWLQKSSASPARIWLLTTRLWFNVPSFSCSPLLSYKRPTLVQRKSSASPARSWLLTRSL